MAKKSYTYSVKEVAATPRNGRTLDRMAELQRAGVSVVAGGSEGSYWQRKESGESDYIETLHTAVSAQDLVAFGIEPEVPTAFPIASYTNLGIVGILSGGGIEVDDNGYIRISPAYQPGAGGIDEAQLASYLSTNHYITENALTSKGYITGITWDMVSAAASGASGDASKYLAGNGQFYQISYSEISGTPTNHVTTDTTQIITGFKTFRCNGGTRFDAAANNKYIIVGYGSGGNCINGYNSSDAVDNLYLNYRSTSAFTLIDGSNNLSTAGDLIAYGTSNPIYTSVPIASTTQHGLVRVDGSTITIDANGIISAVQNSGGGEGGSGVNVAWGTNSTYSVPLTVGSTQYTLMKSNMIGSISVANNVLTTTLSGTQRKFSLDGHTHSQYLTDHQSLGTLTLTINNTSKTWTPTSNGTMNFTVSGGSGSGGTTVNVRSYDVGGKTINANNQANTGTVYINFSYGWLQLCTKGSVASMRSLNLIIYKPDSTNNQVQFQICNPTSSSVTLPADTTLWFFYIV